ncbi:ketosteroid isomerase family protein [Nonomuraea angiospora]|uniref:ketosteroid isomerase family protein n=1 Tax=Nonomuraea angiospora TaxID=46172 RepID=UPI0033DF8A7F
MDRDTLELIRDFTKNQYFYTLDNNLPDPGRLFRESTVITFNGETLVGKDALPDYLASILAKYNWSYSAHTVHVDAHPLADGTILALVNGHRMVNGQNQRFAQTFILVQDGDSYYVAHGIYQDISNDE